MAQLKPITLHADTQPLFRFLRCWSPPSFPLGGAQKGRSRSDLTRVYLFFLNFCLEGREEVREGEKHQRDWEGIEPATLRLGALEDDTHPPEPSGQGLLIHVLTERSGDN